MHKALVLTSGPATIVDPEYIELLGHPPRAFDEIRVHQIADGHRVFLQGQFGGFRLYLVVTHSRFTIASDSVQRISETHFTATVRCELERSERSQHEVTFFCPPQLLPFSYVTECTYGHTPDSFEFRRAGAKGSERFPCDLTFLTRYGENPPQVPLEIEYVGMTSAPGREAQHRLGEGHKKLQLVLAQQSRRGGGRATSLVLYRPSELDPPVLAFPDVIETLEASLIQYFKPTPLNIEHLDFPNNTTQLTTRIAGTGTRGLLVQIEAPRKTSLFSKHVPNASSTHQIFLELN
jgi:hypothetical protein